MGSTGQESTVPLWRRKRDDLTLVARVAGTSNVPPETRVRGDLRGGRFAPETSNVVLERVSASEVDFSSLHLWRFYAEGCRFSDCDFSNVRVKALPFASGGSLFERCTFRGARLGDMGRVRLEDCDLTEAELRGWFAYDADIVNCRFGGRLSEVVFSGTDAEERRRNDFHGNDFRDAELDDVSFSSIDLDAQLLPESDLYVRLRHLPSRLTDARAVVASWPDPERRREAESLLDALDNGFAGEEDVFTRRDFLAELASEHNTGEQVVALVEGSRQS